MSIEVRNLNKAFGKTVVCDHLNLDIPAGELVALLGPSGSGKTTLLRIVAGLEVPDSGQVLFHGDDATDTAVRDRNVGFVFQHYALFGHMTIFENVAFGLRLRPKLTRPNDAEISKKVMQLLKLVQLDWLALQFLGDVNLFHGRIEHAPGGGIVKGDTVYVRPHELEILADAVPDGWAAMLSQTLTVGPHTRIEFKRDGDEGYLDVELLRSEYTALRERLQLQRGSRVWLRPRKVTRFEVGSAV